MGRGNIVLLNVSGGEVSPEMYARLDLSIYQRANGRVQNYIVLPQGGLQFRNAFRHVRNTRNLGKARLIPFTFSEADTYIIEVTDKRLRFYRNFGAVLDSATKNITDITKANPAVVTSATHGFTNGQEIFIAGIVGMKELNGQSFRVSNATTNTFELQDIFGQNVNSTNFDAYASGGTANLIYGIDTLYEEAYIDELHTAQSADVIDITHQKYPPMRLSRTGHTAWTLSTPIRTADPFSKTITGITQANPGVFTATTHGLAVDDEVFVVNVGGMTQVNMKRYRVNTVPTSNTFTLKDFVTGTPLNTTSFTAFSSNGQIYDVRNCPKTCAYTESRLWYANWLKNPSGLAASRAPNVSTGATQFGDFTTGANATDAILTTLSTVFDKLDSIQWIRPSNKQLIVGCSSSIRRLTGDTIDDPVSPSSLRALPINNVGSAGVQAFSNGQSVFWIDATGRRTHSFLFAIQSNDLVTVNQNLVSSHLSSSRFKAMAQQRGDSGLLWLLREDGVLTGLTFNELESIFGWHRHYIGGRSDIGTVEFPRAKVLSIAVEPRLNDESILWAVIERKVGNQVYRSVEYLTQPVRFLEMEDFFSETTPEGKVDDLNRYYAATFEQLKDSVHVDSAHTYDGSALSTTISMTPADTTGVVTVTASASFFDASMVGREIWKKYDVRGNGGGRGEILSIQSPTQALVEIKSPFDNNNVIPAGSWYLTTDKVFGMLHLVGEEVTLQEDGAPGGTAIVQSDGSVQLSSQSSKVHLGFFARGLATTLNLDVAGERGSAEAKIRKIIEILPRYKSTIGAKIGTEFWNATDLTFKTVDDITDRPTRLHDGIQSYKPQDSWDQDRKRVVHMQHIPSPQTLLSLDILVETADD